MLARLRKRMDENEGGFTLIELLVVIIIIGILAAIAIPVFLSQKTKGYEASMKSDLRTVAQDVESDNVDAQSYLAVTWGASTMKVGSTVTTAGTTVGGDTVKASNGNTITVKTVSATAFCLEATHSGANTWHYASDGGGVAKGVCA